MSRLDYFTIAIVAVCILAILFLLYRTTPLFKGEAKNEAPTQEEFFEEDPYTDADEGSYRDYDLDEGTTPSDDNPDYNTEEETPTIVYDLEEEDGGAASDSQVDSEPSSPETNSPGNTTASSQPGSSFTGGGAADGLGDFLVLAGSFSVKANAETMAEKIRDLGYSETVVVPFDRGKYATVLVDRFVDISEAERLAKELKGKGVSAYVHKKREAND